MAAKIPIILWCDHYNCEQSVQTTATAVGKESRKVRFKVEVPKDWRMGRRQPGWGTPSKDLECACHEHKSWFDGDID